MSASYPKVCDAETIDENAAVRAVLLDKAGYYTARTKYSHIPEAKDLTWEDDFFDNDDDDIVAAFDFDYDAMESYNTQMGFVALGFGIFYPPVLAVAVALAVPWYIRSNAQWTAKATHVAITRDGVRLVHDQRKTCYGCHFSDAGKHSKTGMFNKGVTRNRQGWCNATTTSQTKATARYKGKRSRFF